MDEDEKRSVIERYLSAYNTDSQKRRSFVDLLLAAGYGDCWREADGKRNCLIAGCYWRKGHHHGQMD